MDILTDNNLSYLLLKHTYIHIRTYILLIQISQRFTELNNQNKNELTFSFLLVLSLRSPVHLK